jgi:UDP-N-acetylglucosamine 1-carboxyvinyltransferase
VIENVPDLSDVHFMAQILEALGASVQRLDANTWQIQAANIHPKAPYELVRKMRASVCLMGPLLGRTKSCTLSMPGGCVIGHRPIDLHLKGFAALGCQVEMGQGGYIHVDANKARGHSVFLGGRHGSTVTGTANVVMAAVLTPGVTRLESAACEPEVVDLCHMLQSMGAKIEGIGSPTLHIQGVDALQGCRYRVIPDRIEAGTFILAGLITRSNITVTQLQAHHLHALLDTLDAACAQLDVAADGRSVTVYGERSQLRPCDIVTLPYPGYPTDLQAQMLATLTLTPGVSMLTERIYPQRFMHAAELARMGAQVAIEGPSAIVQGVPHLCGAPVMASDLRASAALVLAGLAAQGTTLIHRIYHLERGYERCDAKLNALGASIERVCDSELSAEQCL